MTEEQRIKLFQREWTIAADNYGFELDKPLKIYSEDDKPENVKISDSFYQWFNDVAGIEMAVGNPMWSNIDIPIQHSQRSSHKLTSYSDRYLNVLKKLQNLKLIDIKKKNRRYFIRPLVEKSIASSVIRKNVKNANKNYPRFFESLYSDILESANGVLNWIQKAQIVIDDHTEYLYQIYDRGPQKISNITKDFLQNMEQVIKIIHYDPIAGTITFLTPTLSNDTFSTDLDLIADRF